jgi:hypothetical protein
MNDFDYTLTVSDFKALANTSYIAGVATYLNLFQLVGKTPTDLPTRAAIEAARRVLAQNGLVLEFDNQGNCVSPCAGLSAHPAVFALSATIRCATALS